MEASGCVWELPVGVLVRILSFLPARSIAFCYCVAKAWMWAAQDSECVEKVALGKPLDISRSAKLKCVEELLTSGPIPELRDFLGCTPLIHAATHGHKNLIDALLAVGADVNSEDIGGEGALLKASRWGHYSVMDALLKAGAKVNAENCSGMTPLLIATTNGDLNGMKILLAEGASILSVTFADCVDFHNRFIPLGSTALHIAARRCHVDAVQLLLDSGASTTVRDSDGKTAREVIRYHHQHRILQELLQ